MQWHNWSDFLNMGGYGFYVWVSFGVTFGCMAIELWQLWMRKLNHLKLASRGNIP
ncbi:MAG: heme exporter protein CcmD [Methylophilaceae bacterium]